MSLQDLFRDVLTTLWSNKLRTFLTMFGIAWGIVSIVLMVAAGEGMRVGQQKQQQNFARDLMIVFPAAPACRPEEPTPDAASTLKIPMSPSRRTVALLQICSARTWQ